MRMNAQGLSNPRSYANDYIRLCFLSLCLPDLRVVDIMVYCSMVYALICQLNLVLHLAQSVTLCSSQTVFILNLMLSTPKRDSECADTLMDSDLGLCCSPCVAVC